MEVSILDDNHKKYKLNKITNMVEPDEIKDRLTDFRYQQSNKKKTVQNARLGKKLHANDTYQFKSARNSMPISIDVGGGPGDDIIQVANSVVYSQ